MKRGIVFIIFLFGFIFLFQINLVLAISGTASFNAFQADQWVGWDCRAAATQVVTGLSAGQIVTISNLAGHICQIYSDCRYVGNPSLGDIAKAGFYDASNRIAEYSIYDLQTGVAVPAGATTLYVYDADRCGGDNRCYCDNSGSLSFNWEVHNACTPTCTGKECGDDGCGGSCGTCKTAPANIPPVNVALNKPASATASSSPASRAVDGLLSNPYAWNSGGSGTNSLTIDLQGDKNISNYTLCCGGPHCGNTGIIHFYNSLGTELKRINYQCLGQWNSGMNGYDCSGGFGIGYNLTGLNSAINASRVVIDASTYCCGSECDWTHVTEFQAVCTPNCYGKFLGPDGCGGDCSIYATIDSGLKCSPSNKCVQCLSDTDCLTGQQCNLTSGQCYLSDFPCSNINQTILKLYSYSNSKASLWNDSGNYAICYDALFGRTYDQSTHDCNKNNTQIIYLSSQNNSLVSITNSTTYNIPVCFGNLSTRIINIINNSDSLITYYPFEGNVKDYSIKNNNGVVTGAITAPGINGQGYLFNGINNYITLPLNASLENFTENSYTMSLWFNAKGLPSSTYLHNVGYLLCKQGWHQGLFIDNYSNLNFGIYNSTTNGFGILGRHIELNTWYHVVGVVDVNSKIISLYLNGALLGTQIYNGELYDPGATSLTRLGICGDPGGSWDGPFNGTIDEVKIWNKALSYQEVISEYDNSCNGDGKLIFKLSGNTNAFAAYGVYVDYPLGICAKEIIIPGNATWQDLIGNKISSAGKEDTVKLVLNRTDISSKTIIYDVYKKKDCSFSNFWDHPLECLNFLKGDSIIGQSSSIGFLNWKANETGEFYFNARVQGFMDNYSSNLLNISGENNAKPIVNIIKPLEYSNFTIKADGFTNAIPFEIFSSDADDLLDAYWNFGDGNITNLTNCNDGVSNCNISHKFNRDFAGARIINATVKESTRTQTEYDLDKLFFYKEGLTLFVIIDSPYYKTREFPATPIVVSAKSTYVSNCSFSSTNCDSGASSIGKTCMQINDSVNPLDKIYCYRFAESSSPKFRFNWTIDGNTSAQYPTNASTFKIIFPKGGKHDVGLKIIFNMSM